MLRARPPHVLPFCALAAVACAWGAGCGSDAPARPTALLLAVTYDLPQVDSLDVYGTAPRAWGPFSITGPSKVFSGTTFALVLDPQDAPQVSVCGEGRFQQVVLVQACAPVAIREAAETDATLHLVAP